MPSYFHLSAHAWRQLRRAWKVPHTAELDVETYWKGSLRAVAALAQTLLAGRARARAPMNGGIVVLGFWRSGTTLLHELLCTDTRFGFPTTYACLNPHHFILTEARALARMTGQVQRPQDRMMVGMRTPQEDEFALLCLGARSPYEGLIARRNFGDAFALADPDDLPPAEAARWCKTFTDFYRGVSLTTGGKPLVLKSPAHSYRVAVLRRLLPDARFVLIVRDPLEVLESMLRTYRALTDKYGLGPALSDDELREFLLAERVRFEAKLQAGIAGLPASRFAIVKFEELTRDSLSVIEGLYRQLEIPGFETVRPKLMAEIAKRKDYVQDAILPAAIWHRRITKDWAELFARYGYPLR
jgi:hypothetical protein